MVNEDGGELQGPVIQYHASFTSTVLIGKSSEQRYFLKAPTRGSNEVQNSVTISSIFKGHAVEVLATSPELACFVTRGLEVGKVSEGDALDRLGRIQKASISHVGELKRRGVVVRDMNSIRDQIKRWADGLRTERVKSIRLNIGQSACYLMYLCRRLSEFKVPLTLFHGDFAAGNVGSEAKDSEKVVLFDWEYSCISHPFLDFYRCRKEGGASQLCKRRVADGIS